jgi:hypothetical protein
MAFPPHPEDRPDPNENMPAMRARIPDHVARGEISTGVIVVTGGTEYVLDFVRNLPRPNAIVARVVLPHMVMPQFIEALTTNIELFRQRYGDLPGVPNPVIESHPMQRGPGTTQTAGATVGSSDQQLSPDALTTQRDVGAHTDVGAVPPDPARPPADSGPQSFDSNAAPNQASSGQLPPGNNPQQQQQARRQNPQEVYDDLKLRDEILSGAYANAVMIGHGPFEFSFDFITNFYPQSAVSCRVYLASGHIWRLLESLKQSWEQLRPRLGNQVIFPQQMPPKPPPQPPQSPPFGQ